MRSALFLGKMTRLPEKGALQFPEGLTITGGDKIMNYLSRTVQHSLVHKSADTALKNKTLKFSFPHLLRLLPAQTACVVTNQSSGGWTLAGILLPIKFLHNWDFCGNAKAYDVIKDCLHQWAFRTFWASNFLLIIGHFLSF